jgi:hypothetical protein
LGSLGEGHISTLTILQGQVAGATYEDIIWVLKDCDSVDQLVVA